MKSVYTVSWVNSYIKDMVTQDFLLRSLYVKGEASNVKYHSSGHLYFTLKDSGGVINCVMFSGNVRNGLDFRLKDGDAVIVGCSLNVYEKGGTYNLKVYSVTLQGLGELYEKYEKLKAELEEMGMFDSQYKLPVPEYIQKIGVIAAYPGEAVHDIIAVATRRNPYIQIVVYPSYVQGEKAAASVTKGIAVLQQMDVDIIIVARGGGSVEDLWAFNERAVAEAFFNCRVPIVSAIGHEKHTPIADFVADLRASTPSAAAELATKEIGGVLDKFSEYQYLLHQVMMRKIKEAKNKVDASEKRLQNLSPRNRIKEQKLRLEKDLNQLNHNMDACLENYRYRMAVLAGKMEAVSPLARLAGGYAFVKDEQGKKVTSVSQLKKDEVVSLHYNDGHAEAVIREIHNK